ncbi:hypothetical protein [Glycomyces sp. MUSA5-2]|uniref:hypothetical protein n=1 Tax=Glycomyces sp. MUSA5-2 TaxID=2053002 RepID=UPI00300872D7
MRTTGNCRRPHLSTFMEWAAEPILHLHALPTGPFTSRSVQVRELRLWVVVTADQYAATEFDAYPLDLAALAAAQEVTRDPDTRGIYRTWVPDGQQPPGEPITGAARGVFRSDSADCGR